jgi:DNA-binding protein H-NS
MATSAKAGQKAASKKTVAKPAAKAQAAAPAPKPEASKPVENLKTLEQKIRELQSQADRIRAEERHGAIAQAKELVRQFGLSARELGLSATITSAKRRPSVVKYSDGKGNTWGGVGKRPRWLNDALAQGKKVEDFLVGA